MAVTQISRGSVFYLFIDPHAAKVYFVREKHDKGFTYWLLNVSKGLVEVDPNWGATPYSLLDNDNLKPLTARQARNLLIFAGDLIAERAEKLNSRMEMIDLQESVFDLGELHEIEVQLVDMRKRTAVLDNMARLIAKGVKDEDSHHGQS